MLSIGALQNSKTPMVEFTFVKVAGPQPTSLSKRTVSQVLSWNFQKIQNNFSVERSEAEGVL